jgi:hypothetical protein
VADTAVARRAWQALEPCHAVAYFAPQVREHLTAAGLRGGWMCYFASRAAPMGAVTASTVTAAFCYFNPALVARAIPDAWSYASPGEVVRARLAGVAALYHPMVQDTDMRAAVAEAAGLARAAAEAADTDGRVLAAATASLDWPDQPHLALFHATSVLREHRGDGHVASIVGAGLRGLEALVLAAAAGDVPADLLRTSRGWSQQEWDGAVETLCARGLLDEAGTPAGPRPTDTARALRDDIEARTDALARGPWQALGAGRTERLLDLGRVISARLVDVTGFPFPNPIGLPRA